jgi:cysteine-rich repeat protein
VLVLVSIAACFQPRTTSCADGTICPITMVCAPGGGCGDPDLIDACTGVGDGLPCMRVAGVCSGGVCVIEGCGNGVVGEGETCDDGNRQSGDGCRADCGKLEVCGDGERDVNEACDDGNTNASDACDACGDTRWSPSVVLGAGDTATSVGMAYPHGVAVDAAGNVYVADLNNNRVRRVDAAGRITTIAGNGTISTAGDGGQATSSGLWHPTGVAVDGLGNLYIADKDAHRVRRVDPNGIITTVAGDGTQGFVGDGGAAINAKLYYPIAVAVDGLGNLYIADSGNHRIRRVDTMGTITTLAGNGTPGFSGDGGVATSAQLNSPSGIVHDGAGRLYIADTANHRIRRLELGVGFIYPVAGNGTPGYSGDGGDARLAQLRNPFGVAYESGALLVADTDNHRIRRIDLSLATPSIATVAGTGMQGYGGDGGAATSARLSFPRGVAVEASGGIFIADHDNQRIRRMTGGQISTFAGNGTHGYRPEGTAATSVALIFPARVAFDAAGNGYVADTHGHRIRRVEPTGAMTTIAGTGIFGSSGDGGPASAAQLAQPHGILVDAAGVIYIADTSNHRIRRIATNGTITTIAGTGIFGSGGDDGPATSAQLAFPYDVAIDASGNLYIADGSNHRIRRIATTGTITTIAGTGTAGYAGDNAAATSAQLRNPHDVELDGAGNLYIADTDNHVIRRIDTNGTITTIAGTGTAGYSGDGVAITAPLSSPFGIALDAAGALYIGDSGNNRIRRVSGGMIATVAGVGTVGHHGDGGAATSAQMQRPYGVVVRNGSLYFADNFNSLIRRVDTAGIITTYAGARDPEGMGPLAVAQFGDPRAFVRTPMFTLVAGGTTGTVQAMRTAWHEVVAGRYPHLTATANLARFRSRIFKSVDGVAFDAATMKIYMTESNTVHAVTIVDVNDASTWTIAPLVGTSDLPGYLDGAAASAQFRSPTGLFFDPVARILYVADTGNHVVRAIDLTAATVTTVAGRGQVRGFFGDGGAPTSALMYAPRAITRCANGDLFIADTGNHRVRRIGAGTISTVLGVGIAASSGEGAPASTFPVNAPLGLACDGAGNLFVSSTTTVRLAPADPSAVVDGTGLVLTIYGDSATYPATVTRCLTALDSVDAMTVHVTDACAGMLLELRRERVPL